MLGVIEPAVAMTDVENARLNAAGLNGLRLFPGHGAVAWGARTLRGADEEASEWKYLPVRRTALFIEESLYRGLQWVVFEPNGEPLWARIRAVVATFLQGLHGQGAFPGRTPGEAYFVRCDASTTTRDDIDRGVANVVVGFAATKPAEFVVIRIEQVAGGVA
jgi:phage tail sheath protein FI